MNLEDVDTLFKALNDAGMTLGFGRDACTNIQSPSDTDDTGCHLTLYDEGCRERSYA